MLNTSFVSELQRKKDVVTDFSPEQKSMKMPRPKRDDDKDEPLTKRQRILLKKH